VRRVRHGAVAIALVGLLVTGCGSTNSSQSGSVGQSEPAPAVTADSRAVGTGGELIPIDSDNVAMAGYNDSTRVMTVLFDSARLYEYYDVPPQLWKSFVAAQPDPWSLVGYPQLVQGGYAYQEITP
jgi:hypothetical protein